MTCSEAAKILGCSNSTVRRAVWNGDLRATMTPGGHLRFNESDVHAYRDELTVVPPLVRRSNNV